MSSLPALLLLCLLLRVEGSSPISGDDFKKGSEDAMARAKEVKKEADEQKMTDEQFYDCFSDINCNLGKEAFDDVFTCYGKVNETEKSEYARWFKDCPKGNFQESDLTFFGVNKKFCTLTKEEQKENNDFFAGTVADRLKVLCRQAENRGRCIRLKKSSDCITKLITEYVSTGKCDTIVKEMQPPSS